MYRESMANGFAATLLFLVFLFLLARHIKKMRSSQEPSPGRNLEEGANGLPPPYATMPPPPSYQEAIKSGVVITKY